LIHLRTTTRLVRRLFLELCSAKCSTCFRKRLNFSASKTILSSRDSRWVLHRFGTGKAFMIALVFRWELTILHVPIVGIERDLNTFKCISISSQELRHKTPVQAEHVFLKI